MLSNFDHMVEYYRDGGSPMIDTATLLVFFSFYVMCYFVVINFRPSPIRKDPKKILPYDNTFISLIHSIISSVLVFYSLYRDYPFFMDDLLHFKSGWHVFTIANTLAYMTYDLMTFYYYPRDVSMFIHHSIILLSFTLSIYLHDYCTLLVVSLLAEGNSIFLHLRKTLQLLNQSHTLLYKLSLFGLSITYLPIRVVPHFYLVWILARPGNVFTFTFQYYTGWLGMAGICAIDVFFFFRFMNTDIFSWFGLEPKKTKKSE